MKRLVKIQGAGPIFATTYPQISVPSPAKVGLSISFGFLPPAGAVRQTYKHNDESKLEYWEPGGYWEGHYA